jgi:hypothetical protein
MCKSRFGKNFDLEKFQNHDTRCNACKYACTTQSNVDRLEDARTSMNDYMKFCRNLRTQVKNRLMVEKFSTFSGENLDPTCTARKHTFNTVYNMDTHTHN